MSSKSRLNPTQIYTEKVDEAFASGDEERLIRALYPLAQHITKSDATQATKDDITATEFVMDHILKRLDRYQVLKEARFSTWAFKVIRFRFIDWIREQESWRKKMAVIVQGKDTEGEDGGEGESAEDHLDRLCAGEIHLLGSGKIPAPEKFGKRELQKLRAIRAVQMRWEGASNAEIAAHLSTGKRTVKPSSVSAMLSRWKRERIYFLKSSNTLTIWNSRIR